MKFLYFDEIDSTNEYLKREYQNLDDMTLVYTGHQTAGKGRLGRTWVDDSSSLLFSILLKKDFDYRSIELLPLLCGVALHQSLNKMNLESQIKWPNDVLIQGKKCAGILLESIYREKLEALVIGIGINVNNQSFSKDLEEKAISLKMALGHEVDKEQFLNIYVQQFESLMDDFLKGDMTFMKVLKENSYLNGKMVYLNYYGENRHCRVIGIDDDGSLMVKDEKENMLNLKSGEVTLEQNY